MITRRVFVGALAGGIVAAPLAAAAQQARKVYRIGILANLPLTEPEGARLWGAFIQGLRELGYVEGKNITIEWRFSEGKYERLPELAADLVRLKVELIVSPATNNVAVAKQATGTIPIVMAGAADPVGSGLVASLARPGGNVTGLSVLAPEIVGKQLELLKEIVPRVSRVAVLWNPTNTSHPLLLREAKVAARSLGVQLHILEARGPEEVERAFATMTRERAGTLLVPTDGMFLLHRARIADLAAKHRLPAIYGLREFVDAGGLMVYGASLRDIDISRNNGYIRHHVQGSSEASMHDHRSRWELLMRRMERRSVVPNSWMSFGELLDKSCLALVQTNSSGLSCGAYPGKRWARSLF